MNAKLGSGWAASNLPRKRLLPRWPRRVWALIGAGALGIVGYCIVSAVQAHARLAPLHRVRAFLTPANIEGWKGYTPEAEPIARLLNGLTPRQMWLLARDRNRRLYYSALSPEQKRWLREAFDARYPDRGPGKLGWQWHESGAVPVYIGISSRRSWRGFVLIPIAFTNSKLRGMPVQCTLNLYFREGGRHGQG